MAKAQTDLVNIYYPERSDNRISIHKASTHFAFEVNFGGRQAGVDTDRESLVRLRDNINKLLEVE